MELIIASGNLHKIREFREFFRPFPHVDVLSLLHFPQYLPPEEIGSTFQENASIKAEHAARILQKWVLADDSGLIVPALKDKGPGVSSRFYAGIDATDADNRKKLLSEMHHLNDMNRGAYFECCLVLAGPSGIKKICSGTCEGNILSEERGRNGFGYDSLFVKNEYEKSFAELEEAVKNRISHRSKAFEKMKPTLEALRA
jgi:XTP/dITP diphosphohydrolase